jgi:hypothetical protein
MYGIVKGRFFCAVAIVAAVFCVQAATANAAVIHTAVFNGNGHTYHLLASSSWPAAQAEAVTLGGNLVTVNNAAENAFIYSTFGAFALSQSPDSGKVNLWLGYNDSLVEGTFVWVSGLSSSYTDWFDGQPQEQHNDEDFAGIRLRGSTAAIPVGHWIDIVSDGRLGDLNYGVVEVEGMGPGAPEPSAFVLAALGGAVGLGGRSLRRRKQDGRAATAHS